MRILYWTDWYLPSIGGAEVFSARLAPALVSRGHEVAVVAGHHCGGLPARVEHGGAVVYRFPFHQSLAHGDFYSMQSTLRQVSRLKSEFRPDVLHLNTLGPSVLFHLRARAAEAPVLLTMHSPVAADAARADTLYGQTLRGASWINCNSRAVRADLCSRVPELAARSSVTYYGMEEPPVRPAPRPRVEPVVLGFGRLVHEKGFDVAMRAFVRVRRRFPSARLVLVGEGAARAELELLAERLGLADAVELRAAVCPTEVPDLVNEASIVVVPSRWREPFGLVALEAAWMERPVVVSRVGGLVEAVDDGSTGSAVPPEDPAALAAALERLLADPDRADAMGRRARERARRTFGWARCVAEYERLYESLLSVGNESEE